MATPLIRCGFGIGNRVATIANALSRYPEIRFSWKVNRVLPLSHEKVFPTGIEGVEFVDADPGFATRWSPRIAGESWEGAGDRAKANAAYAKILEAMAGDAPAAPDDVAIIARFWRFPEVDHLSLADAAADNGSTIFVLADCRRGAITQRLLDAGIQAIIPHGPELAHDLDRTPESTLAYLSDWKRASAAAAIVTHGHDTSVTYPARAACARMILVNPRH